MNRAILFISNRLTHLVIAACVVLGGCVSGADYPGVGTLVLVFEFVVFDRVGGLAAITGSEDEEKEEKPYHSNLV